MRDIEILSPAGDFDSLVAAVRCGADAVYFGAVDFSARRNAENFDKEGLQEAVRYCHVRGVKCYLTLNIMIKNAELERAISLAGFANDIGIDGIIVQDIGLAALIRRRFPDLPLHASTQMTIHDYNALPILKEAGFKRVVAAREMDKNALAVFCQKAKKLGIEVEVFVHGALCMCVSGQCLLSAVLGSRSGNRGLCAGPCRLPFKAPFGTGYDLSLKDLSILDNVNELAEMGVKSLKIEGRMKRPEYVAAATLAAVQSADSGVMDKQIKCMSAAVFSRSGFTKGYYENRLGKDMFGIRTKEDVLSSSGSFAAIHELYRKERKSVPIDISVNAAKGEPIAVSFSDGGNTVFAYGEIPQAAQKNKTKTEDIIKCVSKLGDTPYYPANVTVNADDDVFIAVSALNALRRNATEKLSEKRAAAPKRRTVKDKFDITDMPHNNTDIYARFYDTKSLPDDISGIKAVVLPLEADFSVLPESVIKIADMPRYIVDDNAVRRHTQRAKKQGVTHAFCGNLSSVAIAKETGLYVIGDTGLNVANDISAAALKSMGVSAVVTSMELTLSETARILTDTKKGIFAYGKMPLMLMRNCPVKNGISCEKCGKKKSLSDRTGTQFPVRCRNGYSELFNSVPLYLADKLGDIKNVDFLLLSFVDETKEEVERIIKEYTLGGTPPANFTRGLYMKGVK